MTLNDIFRRSGELTYYTPTAVIGTLIENQAGGQVTVINPPFTTEKPKKPKKWIKRWHAFGLFFAVSNGRIKKRDTRPYTGGWKGYINDRQAVFEQQAHKCLTCGKEFSSYKEMEAHHALPWARFPELRNKKENIVMLCHHCHKEIHCNPWKNIEMMKQKAAELGIDLKDRYDYDKEDYQHGCEDNATAAD